MHSKVSKIPTIKEFSFGFYFLNNKVSSPIEYKGRVYPSAEHAFMSEKNHSEEWKTKCSHSMSPNEVFNLGRQIQLRADWEEVRVQLMEDILTIKFSEPPLRLKLIETEDKILYNGNRTGDLFWGVDLYTQKGENQLGKILMKIRESLKPI